MIDAPPLGAAGDTVIVQEDEPAPVKLTGVHDNELITMGAKDSDVFCELEL